MKQVIFVSIASAIMIFCMWYPGFMLSRNVIKAVRGDNPTGLENLIAVIPGLNMMNPRREFYGSSKLVWIPYVVFVVTLVLKLLSFYLFPLQAAIVITFLFYGVTLVYWLINGYVLQDIAACSQCGMVARVCAFIFPPLAQWIIGRNCIGLIREMMENLETAE